MDQEMRTNDEGTAWPELSADLSLARSSARSITLDTHRASADGRILEVTAQLDLLRTRLASLEHHVFDASTEGGVSDGVLDRFSTLETEVAATSSEFEGLASRVAAAEESVATTMLASVEGFDSRLSVVEDSRIAQTNELNELTGYLEQAFTRISELALLIEEERGANAAARAESFNQISDVGGSFDDKVHELTDAVNDLNTRLNSATSAIDESTSAVNAALEGRVDDLDERLTSAESRIETVDEISTSIQFLNSRADALEAAQLNTSGHLIDEVTAHGQRLDRSDDDIAELRTQITSVEGTPGVTPDEIEQIKDVIDAQAEITASHERSHQATTDTIAANSAIIDTNTADIAEHSERLDRFDHANDQIGDALEAQSSVLEAHAKVLDSATDAIAANDEAISAQATRLNETGDAISENTLAVATHTETLEAQAALLDETTEAIGDHALAIASHAEQLAQLADLGEREGADDEFALQLADHADAVARALSAAQEANEAAHHASDRIGSLSETAELISQRVDLGDATSEDLRDRLQSTQETVSDAAAKLSDLDGNVSSLNERVENAAAALEAANARIDETESSAFDARSATDSVRADVGAHLDQHSTEIHGRIDDTVERLDGRIDETATRISEVAEHTNVRIDEVHGRVDETVERVDGLRDDVARTHEQVETIEGRVEELASQQSADTETARQQAISGVQDQVADLRGVVHSTSESIDSANSRIEATEQLLDVTRQNMHTWIEEANATSTQTTEAIQIEVAGRLDETTAQITEAATRLSAVDAELNERIISVEARSVRQERVEALAASIASVEEGARGTHSLAENLRVLQAEMVGALQSELQAHTAQLEEHARQLSETPSPDTYASADRVQMLEAKIVEALQTISQLTQLQRRNTAVETQLTETLTATSQGVEHTQQHVIALRSDLDAAQQRIGQLEAAFQSISVAPAVPPVEAAMAPAPTPEFSTPAVEQEESVFAEPSIAEPIADAVIDDLNELTEDDDTDTGWFTESYARKNAS